MKRLEKIGMLILVVVVVLTFFPLNSQAAFDGFLKIDGIPGGSTGDVYVVEILFYESGISRTATATGSGGCESGKRADCGTFCLTKTVDKLWPKLAVACADETHLDEIVLELCGPGGEKLKYMLRDCIVSYHWVRGAVGNDDAGETLSFEQVCFNYGNIEWTYTPQQREDDSGRSVLYGRSYNVEGLFGNDSAQWAAK